MPFGIVILFSSFINNFTGQVIDKALN